MVIVENRDTGSLRTEVKLPIGTRVQIMGESRSRYVTYVMGSDRNGWHACFKGQGALPVGVVEWERIDQDGASELSVGDASHPNNPPSRVQDAARMLDRISIGRPTPVESLVAPVAAFSGYDSAWTRGNRGAIATIVLHETGLSFRQPRSTGFGEAHTILAAQTQTAPLHVLAIDQPLIVQNATGSRPVEAAIRPTIGRFKGGMQPSSRARAEMFGDGAPIWDFLAEFDGAIDPTSSVQAEAGRYVIEVYPALATLGLFELFYQRGCQPKYNPANRANFILDDWAALCARVAEVMRGLQIAGGEAWCVWAGALVRPSKADQDALDATLCAVCAYLWWRDGLAGSVLVGDLAQGYIVAPTHARLNRELEESARRYQVPCSVTI